MVSISGKAALVLAAAQGWCWLQHKVGLPAGGGAPVYCMGRGSAAHVLQDGLRNKCMCFHSLPQNICVCVVYLYLP